MSGPTVFLVVTGLPGSGKSTVGKVLARELGLPLLDKDDILEGLFDTLGSPDLEARERLSRAADEILFRLAESMPGAVLVNWWRRDSAPARLEALSGPVVEVLCEVPVEIARERWMERRRHPGHHDGQRPAADPPPFPPLLSGPPVVIDTSGAVDEDTWARAVAARLTGG